MLQENSDNLEALIREEKHRIAVEFFQEAWDSALQEGIETHILADSALHLVLSSLHAHDGEASVSEMVAALEDRLKSGHFNPDRILQ